MQPRTWDTGDFSRKDDPNKNKIVANKTDIYGVEHAHVRVISILNNTFTGEDMDTHFNRVFPIKELGDYEVKSVPASMRDMYGNNVHGFNWKAAAKMKLTDQAISERKLEFWHTGRIN